MTGIPKISEAANLALHAMVWLARPGAPRFASAAQIAAALGVSESHLGKVLQRLARNEVDDLIVSTRGARGGFALARPARGINLLEIIEAVDGPLTGIGCLLGTPICGRGSCALTALLDEAVEKLRAGLSGTNLSDFAAPQR